MPRVPGERAGHAGGIPGRVGYVNICKQSPDAMLGAFGGGFRWGKNIIRV